jgi:hypothetical protein
MQIVVSRCKDNLSMFMAFGEICDYAGAQKKARY